MRSTEHLLYRVTMNRMLKKTTLWRSGMTCGNTQVEGGRCVSFVLDQNSRGESIAVPLIALGPSCPLTNQAPTVSGSPELGRTMGLNYIENENVFHQYNVPITIIMCF